MTVLELPALSRAATEKVLVPTELVSIAVPLATRAEQLAMPDPRSAHEYAALLVCRSLNVAPSAGLENETVGAVVSSARFHTLALDVRTVS